MRVAIEMSRGLFIALDEDRSISLISSRGTSIFVQREAVWINVSDAYDCYSLAVKRLRIRNHLSELIVARVSGRYQQR